MLTVLLGTCFQTFLHAHGNFMRLLQDLPICSSLHGNIFTRCLAFDTNIIHEVCMQCDAGLLHNILSTFLEFNIFELTL